MDAKGSNRQKKLLFAVFVCYGLSFSMLVGLDLSLLRSGYFADDALKFIVGCLLTLTHGLFLFGLLQPEKRKKVLALALFLKGSIMWFWYGVQQGSFLYALMSYPIDFYADALLIAYILSTKRGATLRIITEILLSLRAVELVITLLFTPGEAALLEGWALDWQTASFVYWLFGSLVILLRFAARILLTHGLRLPEAKLEDTQAKKLDENYLTSVEQEKADCLCIECGSNNPLGGAFCVACGKELKEDRSLFENFPEKERLSQELRLAYNKLSERDWNGARELCESALETRAERVYAFIGLFLAELQYESFSELLEKPVRLELQELWQQAVNASQGEEKERLIKIRRMTFNLYQKRRRQKQYANAVAMRSSESLEAVLNAAMEFAALGNYEDAPVQARRSLDCAREMVYREAIAQEQREKWEEALSLYQRIPGWMDVIEREAHCKKMEEQRGNVFFRCTTGGKLAVFGCFLLSALLTFLMFF